MKSIFIRLLFVYAFVSSCTKTRDETHYFKVTVVQTSDVSCYRPVLDFLEDSSAIRHFTNRNDIAYTVLNLPANFTIRNKKLFVEVTTLKPEEEFPCNTLGVPYPRLKIVDVKDRP